MDLHPQAKQAHKTPPQKASKLAPCVNHDLVNAQIASLGAQILQAMRQLEQLRDRTLTSASTGEPATTHTPGDNQADTRAMYLRRQIQAQREHLGQLEALRNRAPQLLAHS